MLCTVKTNSQDWGQDKDIYMYTKTVKVYAHRATLKDLLKNPEGRHDMYEIMLNTELDKMCQ